MYCWRSAKIWQLCVSKNYYTCGSNEHYNLMLENCDDGYVNSEFIAYDIYFHSDINTRPLPSQIIAEVKAILEPDKGGDLN